MFGSIKCSFGRHKMWLAKQILLSNKMVRQKGLLIKEVARHIIFLKVNWS